MYLSKLEIFGFKSFAHKVQFLFDDGITAIIGPNGCGKSNIVDAIRWVLGEQRTSLLRLDRMENVIFNGTTTRKSLSMTEVSLYIENTKNILPSVYSEVKITRRLYRSGESEYLVNNQQVRLKDIINLFADTGMGSDAYSVIELKMIEQILSENTEDRRRLFEEAAGIKKYKILRRTALRKLETTNQELLRLNDLIGEVQKGVVSLSRQVGKARRYHKIRDDLKINEIYTYQCKIKNYKRDLFPLKEELWQVEETRTHSGKEITQAEAILKKHQLKSIDLEQQVRKVGNKLHGADEKIRDIQQQVQLNEQRITSLNKNIETSQEEINEFEARTKEIKKQQDINSKLKIETKKLTEKKLLEYKKKANQQLIDQSQLEEIRKKYHLFREENDIFFTESIEKKENYHKILIQEANLNTQKTKLFELKSNLEETLGLKQLELHSTTDQFNALENKISNYLKEKTEIHENLDSLEKQQKQLFQEQNLLIGSLEKIKNQKEFTERIISTYEGFSESVQYIMSHKHSYHGIVDTLANMINTPEEYRFAVESYLHEIANYLVVDEIETALQILNDIKNNKKGRLTLIPLSTITPNKNGRPNFTSQSKDAILLKEIVSYDSQYEVLFNYLFEGVILVQNMDDAFELHKKFPGYKYITREGELLKEWGTITGGNHHQSLNLTGRKEQFLQLSKQVENYSKEQRILEEQLMNIEQQISKNRQKFEELDDLINQQKTILSEKSQHLYQTEYEKRQSEERIQEINREIDTILIQITQLQKDSNQIKPQVEELELRHKTFQEHDLQLNAAVELSESNYRQITREVQELQIDYLNNKNQLNELEQKELYLDQSLQETLDLIERVSKAKNSFQQEIQQTEQENQQLRSQFDGLYNERDDIEREKLQLENTYESLRSLILAKEDELKKIHRKWNQSLDRIREIELKIQELELKIKAMGEQIIEKYGDNFEGLLKEYPVPADIDLNQLQENNHELKRKLELLGDVNPLAVKEHEQEKQRLDFMKTQEADLLEAKNELLATIKKLNKTAYTMFMETFDKINYNFREVFSKFFEGGSAELVLYENDDPLEAKIDININIKGRRLSTLNLLSAGEKTLTAISLLFAIYLVKPSPFCILDEVDAPLDDVNISRYTHALNEFSNNTQFILVTHNKMTMQAAQAMYGVTMEEMGVSKVVSVKFN